MWGCVKLRAPNFWLWNEAQCLPPSAPPCQLRPGRCLRPIRLIHINTAADSELRHAEQTGPKISRAEGLEISAIATPQPFVTVAALSRQDSAPPSSGRPSSSLHIWVGVQTP